MKLKTIRPILTGYFLLATEKGEEKAKVINGFDLTKIHIPDDTIRVHHFLNINAIAEVNGKKIKLNGERSLKIKSFVCGEGDPPPNDERGCWEEVLGPPDFPRKIFQFIRKK